MVLLSQAENASNWFGHGLIPGSTQHCQPSRRGGLQARRELRHVAYFDLYLKRIRIEQVNPDTLDFVPAWYGERVLKHAEENGARILMRNVAAPNVMDGLDKSLLG